jgi:hypothetical protein
LPLSKAHPFGDPRAPNVYLRRLQLRLWFSAFAHLITSTLQGEVLTGTELAVASIGQIRLRLFKIAARLTVSVRRIHIELRSAYPLQTLSDLLHRRLAALPTAALKSYPSTLVTR